LFRRHEASPRSRARVVCVVPCYEVAPHCAPVRRETVAAVDCVVAVDDGSRDRTPRILARLAQTSGGKLRVLTLAENRGKGVALVTGLRSAIEHFDFDALVTLDSDGQHQPRDVPRLADQVTAGADLVLGARALDEMPLRSRIGNSLSAMVLRAVFANAPRDTQCGMRAFSPSFAREVVAWVPGGRYETEAWMLLLALQRGVPVHTVSIPTLYEPRNASSHYRPVRDSARIMGALARWRLERPGRQPTRS
jgi:glycosyltransferase involved in cell wall biosynthesis